MRDVMPTSGSNTTPHQTTAPLCSTAEESVAALSVIYDLDTSTNADMQRQHPHQPEAMGPAPPAATHHDHVMSSVEYQLMLANDLLDVDMENFRAATTTTSTTVMMTSQHTGSTNVPTSRHFEYEHLLPYIDEDIELDKATETGVGGSMNVDYSGVECGRVQSESHQSPSDLLAMGMPDGVFNPLSPVTDSAAASEDEIAVMTLRGGRKREFGEINVHQCPVCHKKFSKKKYLHMHTSLHQTSKIQTLDEKDFQLNKKSSSRPKAAASSEPVRQVPDFMVKTPAGWSCKLCGKTFASNTGYKTHARTHSHERPYVCPLCSVGFKEKYHLFKHHKFVHSKERPCKCSFCGKGFKDLTAVRAHERTHSSERPFKCSRCGATFKTRECLWHHENRSKTCGAFVPRSRKSTNSPPIATGNPKPKGRSTRVRSNGTAATRQANSPVVNEEGYMMPPPDNLAPMVTSPEEFHDVFQEEPEKSVFNRTEDGLHEEIHIVKNGNGDMPEIVRIMRHVGGEMNNSVEMISRLPTSQPQDLNTDSICDAHTSTQNKEVITKDVLITEAMISSLPKGMFPQKITQETSSASTESGAGGLIQRVHSSDDKMITESAVITAPSDQHCNPTTNHNGQCLVTSQAQEATSQSQGIGSGAGSCSDIESVQRIIEAVQNSMQTVRSFTAGINAHHADNTAHTNSTSGATTTYQPIQPNPDQLANFSNGSSPSDDVTINKSYCRICVKKFANSFSLQRHMHKIHKEPHAHVCPECNQGFKLIAHLIKHNLLKHGGKANINLGPKEATESESPQQFLQTSPPPVPDAGQEAINLHNLTSFLTVADPEASISASEVSSDNTVTSLQALQPSPVQQISFTQELCAAETSPGVSGTDLSTIDKQAMMEALGISDVQDGDAAPALSPEIEKLRKRRKRLISETDLNDLCSKPPESIRVPLVLPSMSEDLSSSPDDVITPVDIPDDKNAPAKEMPPCAKLNSGGMVPNRPQFNFENAKMTAASTKPIKNLKDSALDSKSQELPKKRTRLTKKDPGVRKMTAEAMLAALSSAVNQKSSDVPHASIAAYSYGSSNSAEETSAAESSQDSSSIDDGSSAFVSEHALSPSRYLSSQDSNELYSRFQLDLAANQRAFNMQDSANMQVKDADIEVPLPAFIGNQQRSQSLQAADFGFANDDVMVPDRERTSSTGGALPGISSFAHNSATELSAQLPLAMAAYGTYLGSIGPMGTFTSVMDQNHNDVCDVTAASPANQEKAL